MPHTVDALIPNQCTKLKNCEAAQSVDLGLETGEVKTSHSSE